jgi:hypothetical protein
MLSVVENRTAFSVLWFRIDTLTLVRASNNKKLLKRCFQYSWVKNSLAFFIVDLFATETLIGIRNTGVLRVSLKVMLSVVENKTTFSVLWFTLIPSP